ncbi:hypothetical protein AHAS_Ahas15G0237600 [Arachis hypogaea]
MMDSPLRIFATSYWVMFLAQRVDSAKPSALSNSHGFTIPSEESWSRMPLRSTYCSKREVILCRCGRLSWGSAVLAWMYRQMCGAIKHSQHNLGGCLVHCSPGPITIFHYYGQMDLILVNFC